MDELTKTDLLKTPCWLIGINMTPFDVHKNAAPINGKIILNQTRKGKFFSLKGLESETENERHTLVIQNQKITIGVKYFIEEERKKLTKLNRKLKSFKNDM